MWVLNRLAIKNSRCTMAQAQANEAHPPQANDNRSRDGRSMTRGRRAAHIQSQRHENSNTVPHTLNAAVAEFVPIAGAAAQPPAQRHQQRQEHRQRQEQQPPAAAAQPQEHQQHQQQQQQPPAQPQQQEHQQQQHHQQGQFTKPDGSCSWGGKCHELHTAYHSGHRGPYSCRNGFHTKGDYTFMLGLITAERRAAAKSQSSAGNTAPQTADNTATPPAAPQTANSSEITALVNLISQQQLALQQATAASAVPTTTASTGTLTISKTMVMNAVLFAFIALVVGILYFLSGRR